MKKKAPNKPATAKRKRTAGSLKRVVVPLEALLRAGQMCANCCWNLAQQRALTDSHEPALRQSYQEWDKAAAEMRAIMRGDSLWRPN